MIKLIGRSSGTSLIGLLTLKFNPNFLSHCAKYITSEKISVTGTNGKTTTSGLIAHILESNNKKVIHNTLGANMLTGIANVFAKTITPTKRFDHCVLETDEAYLTKLYDYINLDYLLVTNLFKDQVDRYSDINVTAKKIQSAIEKNKNLTLFLNADDPVVSTFGKDNKKIFFGIEEIEHLELNNSSDKSAETFNCHCGNILEYSKQFFAHQGHYHCQCGNNRPQCDYKGYVKIYSDFIELYVIHNENTTNYTINSIGLYNAYNALAAISLALELGYNQEEIQNSLNTYKAMFGRSEKTEINGHQTIIQLIKNPAGANEVLKTVDLNSNILIAINDNIADGKDISWLWDTDFEILKNIQKRIVVSGLRANDMAKRLQQAGIAEEKITIIPNINEAVKEITSNTDKSEKLTIMPSYTALLQLKK